MRRCAGSPTDLLRGGTRGSDLQLVVQGVPPIGATPWGRVFSTRSTRKTTLSEVLNNIVNIPYSGLLVFMHSQQSLILHDAQALLLCTVNSNSA